MRDVTKWFKELGLEKYAEAFEANDIRADILADLSSEDLKELGMSLGDRKRLINAISALSASDNQETPGTESFVSSPETPHVSRPIAERRQLTVMLVDLAGSTEMSLHLDPEDLRQINLAYQDTVKRAIERYGGYVARYMGDGVLAYFGYPVAHEDAAVRSILAALDVVEDVKRIDTDEVVSNNLKLSSRVGVATGFVVVGDLIGEGAAQESAVVGETPNLAARLQSAAPLDSVVASDTTRELVRGAIEWRSLDDLILKGFEQPVKAWIALHRSVATTRYEATKRESEVGFVGRQADLSFIANRWERANAGESQIVLVSGEAGIGKSRLVNALFNHLSGENMVRRTFQCSPMHLNSPLFPFLSFIATTSGIENEDRTAEKFRKLSEFFANDHDAAALFAELLQLFSNEDYLELKLTPGAKRQRRIEILVEQIQQLADRSAVLLLFEDLHWADPSTLEVLDAFVDQLSRHRVMVLITHRAEFQSRWNAHNHVSSISLNALSRSSCRILVKEIFADASVDDSLMDEIYRRTEGVPLFVEELSKVIAEQKSGDTARQAETVIPATLQDSLLARLDSLGDAKILAQAAAVIGKEFQYDLLAAAVDCDTNQLEGWLRRLESSGLVYRRGVAPDALYTFKHALICDAAYSSLLRERLKDIHTRIARHMANPKGNKTAVRPELIAYHFHEAGDFAQSSHYWQRAGDQSLLVSANNEAVRYLENTLDCLSRLPVGRERDERELVAVLSLKSALMASKGFAHPETTRSTQRAIELSKTLQDGVGLTTALFSQFSVYMSMARVQEALEIARQLTAHGVRSEDAVPRLVGHRALGFCYAFQGKLEIARIEFENALAFDDPDQHTSLALRFGHEPTATNLAFLAQVLCLQGYPEQATRVQQQALVSAQASEHMFTIAYVLFYGCKLDLLQGNAESLRQNSAALTAFCEAKVLPAWRWYAEFYRHLTLPRNDLTSNSKHTSRLRELLATIREGSPLAFLPFHLGLFAEHCCKVGETRQGLDIVEEGFEYIATRGEHFMEAEFYRLRAVLILGDGKTSDELAAQADLQRSISIARRQGNRYFELRAASDLAELWHGQGNTIAARKLLEPVYLSIHEGADASPLQRALALLELFG